MVVKVRDLRQTSPVLVAVSGLLFVVVQPVVERFDLFSPKVIKRLLCRCCQQTGPVGAKNEESVCFS